MTPRVLVVEDEPDVNELLCQILDVHGLQTEGALDGESGLQRVAEWKPDCLVLDLMLPDVDGFEICRRVKSSDQRVGVLILTALQTKDVRERAFDAGADRFLSKPFVPTEVVEQVRSMSQEYLEGGVESGLRRDLRVDATALAERSTLLEEFLRDLFHMTPLSQEEIQETGKALRSVAKFVREHSDMDRIDLACQVFRDRLEHRLRMECQRTDRVQSGRDLFRRLFGVRSTEPLPSLISHLGNSIWFADDRPELVLTRTFS